MKFSTQRLAPGACSEELEAEAAIHGIPKTTVFGTVLKVRCADFVAVWVELCKNTSPTTFQNVRKIPYD